LSPSGLAQAKAAALALRQQPVCAVYCSPMLRAKQTAEEIVRLHPGLQLQPSPLLNEVLTPYEGYSAARAEAAGGDFYTGAGASYEQPEDIVARFRRFVQQVQAQHAGRCVVAVTHGDVIAFMILWAKRRPLTPQHKERLIEAGIADRYPATGSITRLSFPAGATGEPPAVAYCVPNGPATSH
jgi:probable phosphoglycerate mutase